MSMFHGLIHNQQCALYTAANVRKLDDIAIHQAGIPGLELMRRAGASALRSLRERWPDARHITVLCGPGNNGGDGFVVARLAVADGLRVKAFMLGDPAKLRGDAARCYEDIIAAGMSLSKFDDQLFVDCDGIVDGLFGTGLTRTIVDKGAALIDKVNAHPGFCLSLDIPSGLHADTGKVQGCAVKANVTVTFIAMKQGFFTGDGRQHCGDLVFDNLSVPKSIYQDVGVDAWRLRLQDLKGLLGPRDRGSHKGRNGHVLVIGGNHGYAGAGALCAGSALRTGAGLVTVASRPEHLAVINCAHAELMFRGVDLGEELIPLISQATVIAIGPGLGIDEWSQSLLATVLASPAQRLVIDADALNLIAKHPEFADSLKTRDDEVVLTPHPGEAARLLSRDVQWIEADRFAACHYLQQQYPATIVLKGAGSLISAGGKPPFICDGGNPGMAAGGMGDVLTGIIAGLMAQGLNSLQAAAVGCALHCRAGDDAVTAGGGERGLLASDLLIPLQRRINQL